MSTGNGQMEFGYPTAAIGAVASPVERLHSPSPGQTYRQIGVRLWGEGAYERETVDGSQTKYKTLNCVESGDIIVNKIWARNGSVSVVTDDLTGCFCSGEFPLLAPHDTKLDPRWFYWMTKCRWFWHRCDVQSRGTSGKNRIRPEKFLAIEIPLPPLPEQRRIVAKIERLAAKIDEAKCLHELSMQEALATYPAARAHFFLHQYDGCWKPLGEVFHLINGRAFKPDDWSTAGRRIIRIQNLKYDDATYNHFAGEVEDYHLVQSDDVLFAWSGQIVSLGAHIWKGDEAVLNQHIFNVKTKTAPIIPRFIQEGLNFLIDEMKGQVRGLEMFHIRKQELTRLAFPIPSPAEQRRIVAYLDGLQTKVDELKRLQTESAAELDALLPAILDRAFKGEL
jgi:type I restriction enzyme S subunit